MSIIAFRRGCEVGKRFGRLTVLGSAFRVRMEDGRPHKHVVCECDCGRAVLCRCDRLILGFARGCDDHNASDDYYIYQFRNRVNGKRYIGYTTNPVNREGQHRRGYGASMVHWAIQKYGNENLEFKVLRKVHDAAEAERIESELIAKYKTVSPHGYNGNGKGSVGCCAVDV